MSVFLETNHLFLRDPRGGVEDVASMRDAGFGAIFCNIGDHPEYAWETIRGRARAAGVVCGPWLRTATAGNKFDYDKFHKLLRAADGWESPLIVNVESEIQGTGGEITSYIEAQLGARDAAISMETWPFDNVHWFHLADRPVLPQLFKAVVTFDEQSIRDIWHGYGIKCVVLTFGSYGGSRPVDYDRLGPFGIFTADDCAQRYDAWSELGTVVPCVAAPTPPPDGGSTVPISVTDCPYTGPYSVAGNGLHEGPTAEALKRAMKRAQFGFKNKKLGDLNQVFNADLEGALDRWDAGKDGYGEGRWEKIRALKCPDGSPAAGQYALDEYALRLIRDEKVKGAAPKLGPVFAGGRSVLAQDLTHATSGISRYPAFDDCFAVGKTIVAPEKLEVTKASSSSPGDAFYAEGESGLRYWFGHLDVAPAVGTVIGKGKSVGKTCPNDLGGGPHVHVGINVEGIWGAGAELRHHVNYTHGAPTVGKQLAAGPPRPPTTYQRSAL